MRWIKELPQPKQRRHLKNYFMEQLEKKQSIKQIDTDQKMKELIKKYDRKHNEERMIFLEKHGIIKKTMFRAPKKAELLSSAPAIETVGDFIESFPLELPYEPSGEPYVQPANHLNGDESIFFSGMSGSNPNTGECNLSVTVGQFFDILHTSAVASGSLYGRTRFCGLRKIVTAPRAYEEDVFITATTEVRLPQRNEEVYYLDRGNLDLDVCMVEARMWSMLRFGGGFELAERPFLNAVRSSARPDIDEYDNHFSFQTRIKLPAGHEIFEYSALLLGGAYTSRDFSEADGLTSDKFGFALLDLRSLRDAMRFRIIRDPLGAWEKQPFGGAKITVTFNVHKIENRLSS
jgi:hypothetical protein